MRIENFSDKYYVRQLSGDDADEILQLCLGNPLFYQYCSPAVTKDTIREDFTNLPPGKTLSDKYYVGFYEEERLIAVMDIIDGYPDSLTAFIGFFMMCASEQKKGTGSRIISDLCRYLKTDGYRAVRLLWSKGNPQSEHFWLKNHFSRLEERQSMAGNQSVLAERIL